MNTVHEEKYKGYRIKINQDEHCESPREWDNLATMICFHKRYVLGDKHNYSHEDYSSWEEMGKAIKKDFGRCTILPLYLYDHSGITISTSSFSCSWDSRQVGFIVISNEKIKKEFRTVRNIKKIALEIIASEVKLYDDYLRGNVYSFQILDKHEEIVDSCCGFIGDYDNYILKEAKSIIDSICNQELKNRMNKIKAYIKNKVPLYARV